MDVFLTDNRGWGVRAAERIARGAFIVEYTGAPAPRDWPLRQPRGGGTQRGPHASAREREVLPLSALLSWPHSLQ